MALMRFRVNFAGSTVTGPAVSTFYFEEAGGTAAQAMSALASFYEDLTAVMSESVSIFADSEVTRIDSSTGDVIGVVTTTGFVDVGLSGSGVLAKATQGLIQWRTGVALGGRELRGRTFVPGMVSAAATLGSPTSSLVTALTDAGEALIDDANSQLVIWSRTHLGHADVSSASSPNYFAVLRSRRD